MKINFELSRSDVEHFRKLLHASSATTHELGEAKVLAGAEALLAEVETPRPQGFIGENMAALHKMVTMLKDEEFALADDFRTRVVEAMAYFANPQDLIPDDLPGLGFLDDAIMIAIVHRDLQGEIEAYDEFCAARDARTGGMASDPESYAKFLGEKRSKLFLRLRERRDNLNDWG